jgi:2-polyprenyl-3-methyl-5-hydroxy-6-metoxy-1,4-benzoquinol methylase
VSEAFVHIDCPLCGGGDHTRCFDRGGYVHVRCRSCRFVFVNPQPRDDADVNARLFGRDHPAFGGIARSWRSLSAQQVAERIEALAHRPRRRYRLDLDALEAYRQGGALLDVGCAGGDFLLAARQRGWKTKGVEVARENAQVAAELLGLDVWNGRLEDARFPADGFDVVRANQVIEHLQDPRRFAAEMVRVLRPGGALLVTTINFASATRAVLGARWNYLGSAYNGHIALFTPRTLRRLLEELGCRVARSDTMGFRLANPGSGGSAFVRKPRKLLEKAAGALLAPFGLGGRIRMLAIKRG